MSAVWAGDTIAPVVPTCSARVDLFDFSATSAAHFDPQYWSYYKANYHSWLPGAILGGIGLLCWLLYSVWLLLLTCRHHAWRYQIEELPAGNFISDSESKNSRKRVRVAVCGLILLLTVGTVGLSVWGTIYTLTHTNTSVSKFWNIVDDVKSQAQSVVDAGNGVLLDLNTINQAISTLVEGGNATNPSTSTTNSPGGFAGGAPILLQSVDSSSDTPPSSSNSSGNRSSSSSTPSAAFLALNDSQLVKAASELQQSISLAAAGVGEAVDNLNSKGIQGIQDFEHSNKQWSGTVESRWRYVVLVVLFVGLSVCALVAAGLAVSGTWPRSTAAMLWLFWILTILMALLAGGVMIGFQLSKDGCLYGETFAVTVVNRHVAQPAPVVEGLRYYMGQDSIADQDVPEKVFNANVSLVYWAADSAQPVVDFVASSEAERYYQALAAAGVTAASIETVQALPSYVNATLANVEAAEQLMLRSSWQPLHEAAKEYVCCYLGDTLHMMWIIWLATSSVALALALVLTGAVVRQAVIF